MKNTEKVQRVQNLLSQLSDENEKYGGFSEFPQFCEELLLSQKFLSMLSMEALNFIENEAKKSSYLGLDLTR